VLYGGCEQRMDSPIDIAAPHWFSVESKKYTFMRNLLFAHYSHLKENNGYGGNLAKEEYSANRKLMGSCLVPIL